MKKIGHACWILIGLVTGAATGSFVGLGSEIIKPISTLFLRLSKKTVHPLIFLAIAGDIAVSADVKRLRKVGMTFIDYWAVALVLAASAGLMFVKLIKPGQGITLPTLQRQEVNVDLIDSRISWVPNKVKQAFVEGNLLQVRVFSIFLGIYIPHG